MDVRAGVSDVRSLNAGRNFSDTVLSLSALDNLIIFSRSSFTDITAELTSSDMLLFHF